jgi:hypothetical protein
VKAQQQVKNLPGIWDLINHHGICVPAALPKPYCSLLVTQAGDGRMKWLIGDHPTLARLANQLRSDESLCDQLIARNIYFGFRKTDTPPVGLKRQPSYGRLILNKILDGNKRRVHAKLPPLRDDDNTGTARISDKFLTVKNYWRTQSPQAHHIVEFNNLATIGVSRRTGKRDLDYDGLPCVLLMAEFHQRFVSSHLKETHIWTGSQSQLLKNLKLLYAKIYRNSWNKPLWHISQIIFAVAERQL